MTTTAISHHIEVVDYHDDPADRLWNLYEQAMRPLAARAAQRHLLTREEFDGILDDPRIEKHIAHADGRVVGLATATNQLDAWPLISPDYYRARFPGRDVWYIGFVAIAPRSLGVLGPMIDSLSRKARANGGVTACDFCTFNLDRLKIADRIGTLLHHLDPATRPEVSDAQEFFAWSYTR